MHVSEYVRDFTHGLNMEWGKITEVLGNRIPPRANTSRKIECVKKLNLRKQQLCEEDCFDQGIDYNEYFKDPVRFV